MHLILIHVIVVVSFSTVGDNLVQHAILKNGTDITTYIGSTEVKDILKTLFIIANIATLLIL